MTRATNARVAGVTFLVYIAAGLSGLLRPPGALLNVVLSLVMSFSALTLGVTLYSITRDRDPDVAMLGLVCLTAEGILGAMFIPLSRSLSSAAPSAVNAQAVEAIAGIVGRARALNTMLGATFFAVASVLFCWLLLRGRMVPAALAWLGLLASVLLVIAMPMQLSGIGRGPSGQVVWLPMAAFEIILAGWFLVRGVR